MADSESRKRALEILANPHSHEHEWMGALSILDGKLPARKTSAELKLARYLKRVAGLTVVYTVLIFAWSVFQQGEAIYSLPFILATATAYAMLEATAGLFSLLALWVIVSSLSSFSAPYPTTWLILAVNIFAYTKWNWRPYIFAAINRLAASQNNFKLLSTKSN